MHHGSSKSGAVDPSSPMMQHLCNPRRKTSHRIHGPFASDIGHRDSRCEPGKACQTASGWFGCTGLTLRVVEHRANNTTTVHQQA